MKYIKHISFSMMAIIILVMVVATFIEKIFGSAASIYSSWWFAALWAMLVCASLIYIFRRKMQRRPVLLLLHLSLVAILIGALITHIWGRQGIIHLRIGETCQYYQTDEGRITELPFELQLDAFEVLTYPGTSTPMDFVSKISVKNSGSGIKENLTIAMNNIGKCDGYRFYQSSYDADMQGSVLAVSYDPWGIGVTYTGYFLLFCTMFLLLCLPNEGFRQNLKKLSVCMIIGLLSLTNATDAQASALDKQNLRHAVLPDSLAEKFCELYVNYNGRICPLQTVAYAFTNKLYGKPSCAGYSAEQVLTGWLIFPSQWKEMPLKAKKTEVQSEEQMAIIQMLINGKLYEFISIDNKLLSYVNELAVTGQYDKLNYTLGKLHKYQKDEAGDVLPTELHSRAERIYNKWNITRPLAMAFATLGILLFILYLSYWLKGISVPRWISMSVTTILCCSTIYEALMLIVRWFVSGHLPLTNGHETMQFLAFITMLLTLLMQKRFFLIIPFGYLLSGLTLLVSMMGQSNPQITPLMPVLASPLLSIHVCIIMLAYSLLAFTFLNGITSVVLTLWYKMKDKAYDERLLMINEQLYIVSRILLYPALFCMAAGIFIGAIWANVSWGRYWGWDPKEVWALITLLFYSFALHCNSLPLFKNHKFYHAFMVIAFLTVLMTYFGVNFILGGMHSYANS